MIFNHLKHTDYLPNISKLILLIILIAQLSACASISRGITEAFIGERNQTQVDTRECTIRGSAFTGITTYLDNQTKYKNTNLNEETRPTLKVLMVHGIGKHLQGYSTRLVENLAEALSLNVTGDRFKEIIITTPQFSNQFNGRIRVQRFTTKQEDQEMLFYELTWSEITDKEKEIIAYDDSGVQSFRRANMNHLMKEFMNSHISDPLIYLGESQEKIQVAVAQSFCWMLSRDWNALDNETHEYCDISDASFLTESEDDFVFITHSMGSRIITDSLQRLVVIMEEEKRAGSLNQNLLTASYNLQNKQVPVFMLANQLPLLQLGRSLPEVTNEFDEICTEGGLQTNERFFGELQVVAFSDPNDILSYTVPPKFVDEYLDSRLCINMINAVVNIAEVVDLFGAGQIASPLKAHGGYDNDERVINLIASGIGNAHTAPMINDRCTWLETR